jgi:hypothetical protein
MFHDESFLSEMRRFRRNGSTASGAGSAGREEDIGPVGAGSVRFD